MEVKQGYKRTEVGVIPDDWQEVTISEVAIKVGSGITPRGGNSNYLDFGRPFIRSQNVGWGKLRLDDLVFISDDVHKTFSSTELRIGDVLLNITGASIGRTAVANQRLRGGNVNQHVCIIRTDSSKTMPVFINSQLLSDLGQRQIDSFQAGGNREGLNFSQIRSIKLPLPPTLAEQEAIATALSDADAWIESLEQLIAKKRQIKQGAMQELLTGKRRLPGFSGEWVGTNLGELATFLSGGTPSRSNDGFWTGDIPWISASSLRCFEIWRSDSNVTREAVVAGSKMAPVGSSLLLVRGSALHKEILCGLVTQPVCFNQDVKALVPHSRVVPRFLTMLIRGMADVILKLVSSAGNTAGVLDTKLLKAFAIRLPKPNEQTAIATILHDMDTEIAMLETKLIKARQIKQGMMQELLTGKIRLI